MKTNTLSRALLLLAVAGALQVCAAPYLTNKIWLVIYDPFPTNSGKQHLWDVYDSAGTWVLWNDPFRQNNDLIKLLTMDTHTNVAFVCTRTNVFRFFPRLSNGQRYYYDHTGADETNNYHWSYQSPWVQRPWPGAMMDYDYMLTNDMNAEAAMGTGVCDEIWVWCPPMCGAYESHMFGPGSWWCNSGGHTGNNGYRAYPRRFIAYVFNYERGTDMANHNFGHAMESHMSHFTSGLEWNYGTRWDAAKWTNNYWNTYAAFDQAMPGRAGCGDNHRMPNSTNEYEYRSTKYVWSFARNWEGTNWLSWPRMHLSNWINHTSWTDTALESSIYTSEGECSHLRWWFQHMPHEQPDSPVRMTNGVLMNWYEYLWNYNFCGQELANGVTRYDGPDCDLRGYLTYYIDVPPANTNKLEITTQCARNVDLYVRQGYVAVPQDNGVTYGVWDARANTASGNETLVLTPASSPPLTAGRWYITVHAPYQSALVRGGVHVTARYSGFIEAPAINVPVYVAPGGSGSAPLIGETMLTISGVKGAGTLVELDGSTAGITQTPDGTTWQVMIGLQPYESRTLSFAARDVAGGGVSMPTVLHAVSIPDRQVIAYEGAAYGASGVLDGLAGGFNWQTAWNGNNDVAESGLLYTNGMFMLLTTGNRLLTESWAGESRRTLATNGFPNMLVNNAFAPDGTSIWYSFLIRQENQAWDTSYGGVYLANTANSDTLYIGKGWEVPLWRVEAGSNVTIPGHQTTNGQTYLMVTRIDFKAGNEDVRVWVNPPLQAAAPSDAAATLFSGKNFTFNQMFIACGTAVFSIDELRVGTTWASVAPYAEIPEPGMVVVLGGAGLLLYRRRARQAGLSGSINWLRKPRGV